MRRVLASPRSRWIAVAALYVGLTLVHARPLLPVIGSALPNDIGDPALNTWILWWNAYAVPLTSQWWDAPIFYPMHGALALSETFLNVWPLSAPMQWAGASAVLTYNVLYLLSFPACALAAHALARRLTGRHDAALIAGLAFGFAPYRAAQISHLQTLWACWMPLGLLALHRFLDARRTRDLLLLGLCWIMNGLATGYYLFFFSVLVGLWLLWFARSVRDWLPIGGTLLVASLALAPLLMGYNRYQTELGLARSDVEIESLGADLSALWTTSSYVLPRYWTLDDGPEGELYPGATIAMLVVLAGIASLRASSRTRGARVRFWMYRIAALLAVLALHAWWIGGWAFQVAGVNISLTHPMRTLFLAACLALAAFCSDARLAGAWRRRSAFAFYAVAAALMFVFALGPRGRLYGETFLASAPYAWLMQLPGGHAFRVPARFGMLFALCLAVAAALAFRRLTARGARPALIAVVCAAVGLEGLVLAMRVAGVPPPLGLAGVERGNVVLELPVVDDVLTHVSDTSVMLRATRVGYTIVNGSSGYTPPHYEILKEALSKFDVSVIRALQRSGPVLVFVHEDWNLGEKYGELIAGLPDARRVLAAPEGPLFQLPAGPSTPPVSGTPLPISSVRATNGAEQARAMIDGRMDTRWEPVRPLMKGDEIRIAFASPVAVSRIEMDLGPTRHDYPRTLEIHAIRDGAVPESVWEGEAAGLAMLAALEDPRRMPVTFDITSQGPVRELVLTLLEDHPDHGWGIAELHVFGR